MSGDIQTRRTPGGLKARNRGGPAKKRPEQLLDNSEASVVFGPEAAPTEKLSYDNNDNNFVMKNVRQKPWKMMVIFWVVIL